MTKRLTTQYWCSCTNTPGCGLSFKHARGFGKHPAKCDYCGSRQWYTEQGVLGVFLWSKEGRYRLEDAVATYVRPAAAEDKAEALAGDYVVRWVPVREDGDV